MDVLLLQEVLDMSDVDISQSLGRANFKLVHSNHKMGLVIAVNNSSGIRMGLIDTVVFDKSSAAGRAVEKFGYKGSSYARQRGIIGIKLTVDSGESIVIATVHHSVFIRGYERYRQVSAMGRALGNAHYDYPHVVVGGDMNHYPGPRKIDIITQNYLGFRRVDIIEPSWRVKGSRHEWMARIGSITTGRKLNSFDAELDAILYKGVEVVRTHVIDIESDHRAIITEFLL